MMRSTKLSRSLLLACVILLLGLSLMLYVSTNSNFGQPSEDKTPDWFMKNANGFHTSPAGILDGSLNSTLLKHYLKANIVRLTAPFFVVFDDQNIPWHIKSNFGIGYQTAPKKLKLWGNVDVHQLPGKDSKGTHLMTTELWYYPATKLAHTDQPVVMEQNDGSTVHAVGMDANLKTGKIHFLSKTEIEYHDSQP